MSESKKAPVTSSGGSWGTFRRNESMLTETQVIHRPNPQPPFDLNSVDKSFEHLFIDPASNFAFCAIQKNACTQWLTVLRNVMENRTQEGFAKPAFDIGRISQEKHGIDKIKDIFESTTSTVVVMVRDPLARFASVFLNKCFDQNCTNRFCLPRTALPPRGQSELIPKGQPISFRHALDWILNDSTNILQIDGHWSLQSNRCGMSNGSLEKYFTIVGKMTKATLQQDAARIMETAGIDRYNIATRGSNGTKFWNDGGVKYKQYREESEEDVLRKLFTPETARQLMKKFQQDYDTFQLPEPDWIDQATGEWMDSLDHHSCLQRAW